MELGKMAHFNVISIYLYVNRTNKLEFYKHLK